METLPLLRDLVICREASSHDRRGGNDNGFTNKTEFVRREKITRSVNLDVAGPGCVYSFWYSWPNHPLIPKLVERAWARWLGKVRIFFNGQEVPEIESALKNFVGAPPFSYPQAITAVQSAGGYISYLPLPFQEGLKITVDGGALPMFFYHLWYHCYPLDTKVPRWDKNQNLDWAKKWHPKTAWQPAGDVVHKQEYLSIPPGEGRDIYNAHQGGTVKCLRMKLPHDDSILKALRLRAWWDDDLDASIDAPLTLLFAIKSRYSTNQAVIKSNARMDGTIVGQDRSGFFFLRLPMPYSKKARLVLYNQGDQQTIIPEVVIEADSRFLSGLGKSAGYLKTQFRESRHLTPGRDYLLAHLKGRGHIVGTVLAVKGTPETFLEGDERIYTDGSRSPLVQGDATETYFNGSWYFCEQAFACPFHGTPTFRMQSKKIGDVSDVTMYRFHPTDFVPYRSEAIFSIQHGPFNDVPGHYSSLVFYYGLSEKSLFQTDYLNMSNKRDLVAHNFSSRGGYRKRRCFGFFEGNYNGQDLGLKVRPRWVSPALWVSYLTIRGIFHSPPHDSPDRVCFTILEHSQPYEFTLKVDPRADAIMLRRVFDQSIKDQRARIEIDGQTAGIWFNAGHNRWEIFAEDDIILSPSTTIGKSELRIRIVPESKTFSAAEYTVFSIKTDKCTANS